MSAIVPWTIPGGTPCCCCSSTQESTFSALPISSAAYAALFAGGTATYDFGVSVNYGSNGSFGSSATQTGDYAIRAQGSIGGGCANTTINNLPVPAITQNTIACDYVAPTSSLIWTQQSSTCLVTSGAIGVYAYALASSNIAYIQAGGNIIGIVSRSWAGTNPSTGEQVDSVLIESSFTVSFITSATTTNGTIAAKINGASFALPVLFSETLSSDFGTVNWIGPTITFTSSAP